MRSRSSARQTIREGTFDVCVIGGGATGRLRAGCAAPWILNRTPGCGRLCLAYIDGLDQAGSRWGPVPAAGRGGFDYGQYSDGEESSARACSYAALCTFPCPSAGTAGSLL